jgi:hypothetical protein
MLGPHHWPIACWPNLRLLDALRGSGLPPVSSFASSLLDVPRSRARVAGKRCSGGRALERPHPGPFLNPRSGRERRAGGGWGSTPRSPREVDRIVCREFILSPSVWLMSNLTSVVSNLTLGVLRAHRLAPLPGINTLSPRDIPTPDTSAKSELLLS